MMGGRRLNSAFCLLTPSKSRGEGGVSVGTHRRARAESKAHDRKTENNFVLHNNPCTLSTIVCRTFKAVT